MTEYHEPLQNEREALRNMILDLCGTDNHLSHCDRSMGASHLCTCGMRRAYRIINGMPLDE